MTLNYESELLFDLMKRDGDVAPSDVLPYESELKEKYLNQVVGAYPKLQDYRPEWLNYNLYHHLPSDFPTESVTNVTSASFHNVVPYAYRCAILKGNTEKVFSPLKNLFDGFLEIGSIDDNNGVLTSNTNFCRSVNFIVIEPSTNYIISTDGAVNGRLFYYDINFNFISASLSSDKALSPSNAKYMKFRVDEYKKDNKIQVEKSNVVTDYEEPNYILQSVKMPVLTTTGKNLADITKLKTVLEEKPKITEIGDNEYEIVTDGQWDNHGIFWRVKLKARETIYLKTAVKGITNVRLYDGTGNTYLMKGHTPTDINIYEDVILSYTASQDMVVMCRYWINDNWIGYIKSPYIAINNSDYEPFKSNISTVNEPIELRGIGDVRDELNCLTGELTERIGEIVLDGSEEWTLQSQNDWQRYVLTVEDMVNAYDFKNPNRTHCDKLVYDELDVKNSGSYLRIYNQIAIYNNEIVKDVEHFKQWLSQNPITIQYELATESIKTVDLTCINEQGENETLRPIEGTMHVNTSSQTLLPLLDMSVPVEATSQNLMSFANIVEEEK